MISVKDFVKNTLQQIAEAARELESEGSVSTRPYIPTAPDEVRYINLGIIPNADRADGTSDYSTIVDFDIAVTAQESNSTGGQAGLSVPSVIQVGIGGGVEASNTAVSRMRFKLPIRIIEPE